MLLLGSILFSGTGCRKPPADGEAALYNARTNEVGCLGRILPVGGTFFVSPYLLAGTPPLVEAIGIKEGERVTAGQPIARLSSGAYLARATLAAQAEVELAQSRLQRAKAAAAPDDVAAAQQEVRRLGEERDQAAREYERNKPLYERDYISKAHMEELTTRLHVSEAMLAQAQERVHGLTTVRPDEVSIARAQVSVAQAELAQARQNASSSIVRSPSYAVVLQVNTHAGEPVGPKGIAEFAEVGRMEVVAEVYESDIGRVSPGENATISADFLPTTVSGTVVSIGSEVETQAALSDSRGTPSDARVVQVHIRVADQSAIANRIKGKVHVVIHP